MSGVHLARKTSVSKSLSVGANWAPGDPAQTQKNPNVQISLILTYQGTLLSVALNGVFAGAKSVRKRQAVSLSRKEKTSGNFCGEQER